MQPSTPNIPALSVQFESQPLTENDVASVILNVRSNKAPGFDKIHARILKGSLPTTFHIITSLMNISFKSNTFARVWKIAEVTCVPKDFDAGNPCNNRPISLLPVLSKVNERWCCHNSLLMNPDKTKLLMTGVPQLLQQLNHLTLQ